MKIFKNVRDGSIDEIEIVTPDDWHLHVRDGEPMQDVVPHSARQF